MMAIMGLLTQERVIDREQCQAPATLSRLETKGKLCHLANTRFSNTSVGDFFGFLWISFVDFSLTDDLPAFWIKPHTHLFNRWNMTPAGKAPFVEDLFTDPLFCVSSHVSPNSLTGIFSSSVTFAALAKAGSWWMGSAEEVWLRFDPRPVTESPPMGAEHGVTWPAISCFD